jgi:HAD superfamily hydrolase (TIGR01509 family)
LAQSITEIIEYQLTNKIKILQALTIEPIEGIGDLILNLKSQHIPIGLASSSPRTFIEAVLRKFNLLEHFDCIVSGEEVDKGKPAPDVYLEAAKLLETDAGQCVVIEDSKNGVAAAKAAGMRCIGFVNPNSGNQDLSKSDLTVHSIRDIELSTIQEWFA